MLKDFGKRKWMRMGIALALILPATPLLKAQQYHGLPQVNMQSPVVQNDPNATMATPEGRRLIAKRVKALNEMRQKALVSDTDKLLKLAQELNANTAPDGQPLSATDRMKKLAQIEKLAKRVRERMSFANWATPNAVTTRYSVTNW